MNVWEKKPKRILFHTWTFYENQISVSINMFYWHAATPIHGCIETMHRKRLDGHTQKYWISGPKLREVDSTWRSQQSYFWTPESELGSQTVTASQYAFNRPFWNSYYWVGAGEWAVIQDKLVFALTYLPGVKSITSQIDIGVNLKMSFRSVVWTFTIKGCLDTWL